MEQTTPKSPSSSVNEKEAVAANANTAADYDGGAKMAHVLTEGRDNFVSPDDVKRTKRIMRAIDIRILPIASILYLFSFLDRSAIGNARVAGMNTALGLTYNQYAASVSVFFALYCLLEVPSNLALKKYGAKIWLPFIVVLWGLFMLFTGLVKNFAGLFSLRLLLGGAEAGLFPGITYLLTTIYPRKYIQLRIGIFFSAATIAGAFGGLLAYGLSFVDTPGYGGWAWIFIVEGLLTIAFGIGSYFILFSTLDDAKFLSEEDKDFMKQRIIYDATTVAMDESFAWTYVWQGLLDWKTWLSIVTYVCCITPLYSIALTLPTILRVSLGYDAIRSQLMTVPVYAVAAVMVVVWAYVADYLHNRSLPLIVGCGLSAIGWGIGYAYPNNGDVRYGAMFLSALSYAAFPSVVALLTQNIGGKTKRSVCIAIQVGFGGLAGTISSNIFPPKWSPTFATSYELNIIFNCVACASAAAYWALLYVCNQRKLKQVESGEAAKYTPQELAKMGENSPYFMYKY